MSNTSIIGLSDLARIRRLASGEDVEQIRTNFEKERLQSKSAARVKNWGNTLEAIAAAKKKERDLRRKRLDDDQRRIDMQERADEEARREEAVLRAQRMLYEQTDGVKRLKSGIMLSDALKSQLEQLQLKAKRKALEENWDRKISAIETGPLYELANKDAQRKAQQEAGDKETAQVLLEQIAAFHDRKKCEHEAQVRIGMEIREELKCLIDEEQQRAKNRQELAFQTRMQSVEDNKRIQKMKEDEKSKLVAEEEKIKEYARHKEAMESMRKQKAKERFDKKLQYQQDLIDRQANALHMGTRDEDKRIAAQVEQAQMKKDLEEQKQRDFQHWQRELIAESRTQQIMELDKRRKQERDEAKRLQKLWNEQKEAYEKEEIAKKIKNRLESLDLQKFHRTQILERQSKDRLARAEMREYVQSKIRQDKEFDNELQIFAEKQIEKCRKEGCDERPIRISLARKN